MILRMNQRVLGPDIAVRPAVTMNEIQYFEHAPPDPDRVSRINARRETFMKRRQASPIAAGMPQHQGVLAAVVVNHALRDYLWQ